MNWFLDRLREPSSAAGAAAVALGISQFAGVGNPAAVGQAAGEAVAHAAGGNWIGAVVAALGGLAIVSGERGRR
jgi:hypothetical protein